MRCKNCGSTAQLKLISSITRIPYLIQTYKCGCGATRELTYSIVSSISYSPTGTKL